MGGRHCSLQNKGKFEIVFWLGGGGGVVALFVLFWFALFVGFIYIEKTCFIATASFGILEVVFHDEVNASSYKRQNKI